MTTVTPSQARGIHVTPRNPPFAFDVESVPATWFDGDPVTTAAWNALSVLFAPGEKLILEAGRWLVDRIDDPVVAAETRAFLQQEATHSAVHARFNAALSARGLPVDAVDRYADDLLEALERSAGPVTTLSAALAGEQMIGEMGHALLANPEAIEAAAEGPRALFLWHFYEEVEHQAALHDGWVHVFGSDDAARASRVLGAAYVAILVAFAWPATTWAMLPRGEDGEFRDPPLSPTLQHFFGRPGLMRGASRNLVHLLRRDFHPFQVHDPAPSLRDNRHLVQAAWERPRPSAGRHGTATDVPRLSALCARDLLALGAFAGFAARRTRAFVAEIGASRSRTPGPR